LNRHCPTIHQQLAGCVTTDDDGVVLRGAYDGKAPTGAKKTAEMGLVGDATAVALLLSALNAACA